MRFSFLSKEKKSDASLVSWDSSGFSSFSLSSSTSRSSSREKDSSHSWKLLPLKFSLRSHHGSAAASNRTPGPAASSSCSLKSFSEEERRDNNNSDDATFVVAPFDRTEELPETFRRDMDAAAVESAAAAAADGAANWGDDMRAAFRVFDCDGHGFISADELHRLLSGLGDKDLTLDDCRSMINSVDRNGDGRVDFADFQCMMLDTRVF